MPLILRTTRVGTFLLWLVLAVSVPLLLFTGGTVWRVQTAQRQQQELALVDQARDAAQLLDRGFDRLTNGLSVLAGSTALARGDLASFAQELALFDEHVGGVRVTLTASDDRILLRSGGPKPEPMADDTSGQRSAAAVIAAGKPVITNLLTPDDPVQRAVVVAVPVVGPTVAPASYVLSVTLDVTHLIALADLLPSYPHGLVFRVRDRDGVTIARSRSDNPRIGEKTPQDWQRLVARRQSGLLPATLSPEGVMVVRAFSIAPASGYSVTAVLPLREFGSSIRQELVQTVLIGLALLLLSVIAAVALARHLVGALRAVGSGDPRPSGLREVDELATRLRAASAERATAEATLRDSEARLRDLIGTLDLAAIMARELKGTIRFWSEGCVQLYGWSRDEAVGRSSHELLHTQFPVPLSQIEHILLTKGEWSGDLVHYRRDGTMIVAAAHKALKRDVDGRPHMVMESLVDVTALREAQSALQSLNRDLERRVRDEVEAREEAQRRAAHADRIQALGQLAGGIAHDFNNVLQAVAGGAALIARRPADTDAVTRLVRVIADAATRGASITRRMLVLAQRGDLRAEPIDVVPLLEGMREVFIHTLGPAIEVTVEAAPDVPPLLGDRAQLETALVNLGTNARDAMPNGGWLRLVADVDASGPAEVRDPASRPVGGYVRLSVIDTGTGIATANLARVGELFFTTKGVGKGTGLGLSMVKGFADQSGGGFLLQSVVGSGTTAVLWLPATIDQTPQPVNEPEVEDRSRPSGRILLVDDDDLVRDTLTEQLQELGHKVLSASGGTNALAILHAREAVDLMITDLSMPGMDGLMLIKAAQGLRPNLPAILLTGYAGDVATLEISGVAGNTYTLMRKPAPTAVLSARVSALLERL